jgi:glycosyltransferase involved in cell wall biosynthesis
MDPKVSILIPTYNYAHYIGEAIESALQQTYTDFELIIVDDQSADNTDEVVARYLGDTRVRYYKNEKNLGLVGNFNEALRYARGEYIKYLLADDRLYPEVLEKFVNILDTHRGVSLVTSNRESFGTVTKQRKLPLTHLQPGKAVIFESLKEGAGNWIGEPTTVMFRRSALAAGGFSDEYLCLVDWEMWLRLLMTGDCYIFPENLSAFRTHANQASRLILQNFRFTFEEYWFYKKIQRTNPYGIDLEKLDIRSIVRKRALYCSQAMYKSLRHLHTKKARSVFLTSFKIALSEKVLFKPFFDLFKRKKKTNKLAAAN